MNEYIVSLDIGKFEVKAIGRNKKGTSENIKRVNFRTKIYDLSEGYIDVEGNSYKIEYDGKEYIIGEQGENKSNETSKTNLLHKLAGYAAITKFLEADTRDNKIYLVLACPLSVIKIQEAKEEYKSFIKGNGEINIKVNDRNYNFNIEDITIKAEGSGILFTNNELFKNKTVAVVDFGGLNMGFSLYRNGVCMQSNRFIEEHGTNVLTLLVKEQLTIMNKGNLISFDQAEQALEKGHATNLGEINVESVKRINTAKQNFFKTALDIIKEHGYNLNEYDEIIFVGGTTQKIKEIIFNRFKNATIPANSQWTTAEGLYTVACAKYTK